MAKAAGGVLERLRAGGRLGAVDTVVEHHLPGNATALGEVHQLLDRATPGTYDFIAGLIEFQRRHAVGGEFYVTFTELMRSLGLQKGKRQAAAEGTAPKPKRAPKEKPEKKPRAKKPKAEKPKAEKPKAEKKPRKKTAPETEDKPLRVPETSAWFEEYTYADELAG